MENLYGMLSKGKVRITTNAPNNNKMTMADRTTMEGMIANSNLILDFALQAPSTVNEENRHDHLIKSIPSVLFQECEGILLLQVVEAAFVVSANVGTGLLLAHNAKDNTWSAPSAVGWTGVGWGFQGGVARKDVLLFIMDKETMSTVTGRVQFKFGPQASVTVGNRGREVQGAFHASDQGFGATVAFSYSRGFLLGLSLQGNIVTPRVGCNDTFYGRPTTPDDILFGQTTTVPSLSNNERIQDLHRKLELLANRSVLPKTSAVAVQTMQTPVEESCFNEYETVEAQTLEENTNWNESIKWNEAVPTRAMVDVKSTTKEYQTVQTQTVETGTNEDYCVKNKKADPPGIELESDFFDDDVEFIDGCDVVVAAIPRRDHIDEDDDVEFIVSSKEIEAEMKAAGLF